MKRMIPLLLALCLFLSLPTAVRAASDFVIDDADLLTRSEIQLLEESAEGISDTYDLDVLILTVDDLDGWDIVDLADDYYDTHHYSNDCIILVVAMEEREYYIRTIGLADDIFTNRILMDMEDRFLEDLSQGNYYNAFDNFLNFVDERMAEADTGGSSPSRESTREGNVNILLSMGVGAAAAGIVILIMRSQMNTAKPQSHAVGYIKDGSYHLTQHLDLFLYSRVTKTPKPQNNGGSRSGGGSRGGRGGRF